MIEILESLRLLRRHVEGRTYGGADHRQFLRAERVVPDTPEIEQFHQRTVFGAAQKNVVWLDVAVHDLQSVRLAEADGELRKDANHALGADEFLALHQAAQLFALEVLHHHREALVFGFLEGENFNDVIVGKSSAELKFALEALERDVVHRDLGMEDLDRDAALFVAVECLVDAPHPAVGDLAADLITIATHVRPDAQILGVTVDRNVSRGAQACAINRAEPRFEREESLALRASFHSLARCFGRNFGRYRSGGDGCRGRNRGRVPNDAVTERTFAELSAPKKGVEQHRRQLHETAAARAVRRVRDGNLAPTVHRLVTTPGQAGQIGQQRRATAALAGDVRLELMNLRERTLLLARELFLELQELELIVADPGARLIAQDDHLSELVITVALQAPQLVELTLGSLRFPFVA